MALVKVNIDSFKKDLGGIANRLVDKITNKIEDKLENAVEDLFAKGLKKIGLSDKIANEISARFGDSLTSGLSDDYFKSFTPEMNRASPEEIVNNFAPNAARDAQTYTDAIQRASNRVLTDGLATVQFPNHLGKYYMSLKFKQYRRPAPEVRGTLDFVQAFALPIPRSLRESFDIEINQEAQGAAGAVADVAQKYLATAEQDRSISSAVAEGAIALAYSTIVQKADEAVGGVLGQTTGAIANPHIQALFKGVPLRTHRFDWILAPRNQEESDNLMLLIKTLKAYSLPSYSSLGSAALAYPFLCQPQLHPWGDNLIMFSPCLIQNVEVNYAPQGLPAFNTNDNPAFVELSITMLETEMHTADRYGRSGGDNLKDMWDTLVEQIDAGASELGIEGGLSGALSSGAEKVGGFIDSAFGQRNPNQEPDRANTDSGTETPGEDPQSETSEP